MEYEAKTEAANDMLSRDILNRTLPSGKPLRLAALGAQYGVNTTQLREALTRLEEQKLVVAEANRGWRKRFRLWVPRHTELMVAVQDRDRIAATALMEAHSNGALSIFLTTLEQAKPAISAPKPKKEPTV